MANASMLAMRVVLDYIPTAKVFNEPMLAWNRFE
jgi:hypothetical protein